MRKSQAGFGFVELLVVIVVVGILASVAMRTMTSTVDDARRVKTAQELELLAAAIVGDPLRTTDNQRSDFGYFGDVGAFPASLASLNTDPGYATWDGPYIEAGITQDTISYRLDEWGDSYTYSGGLTITSGGGGSTITKKIADASSDYLSNQFIGIVKDANDSLPGTIDKDSVRVRITFPNGAGGTNSMNYTPDAAGQFTLGSIPAGRHQLQVIYLPQDDTLERYVTVLPRHQNNNPPIFKFASNYFGGASCSGSTILRPDGTGVTASLTGCSSANWQCVDDVTADDNTTRVMRADNSWAYDLYRLPDPAAAACAPSKVTVFMRCKKVFIQGDVRAILRVSGSLYRGTSTPLTTSWANYSHEWTSNPATGTAWTWIDINNLQAGVELRGQNFLMPAYCTQVWVVVEY
jgi:prepilin-type N-terminal cleavage/methylation domain-containing protein